MQPGLVPAPSVIEEMLGIWRKYCPGKQEVLVLQSFRTVSGFVDNHAQGVVCTHRPRCGLEGSS